jgi:nitroreductase
MITAKDFSEFTASRRSTRDFLPTLVERSVIDEIIADALTAPSWSNTRPFMVAVASGEQRDRISAEFCSRWEAVAAARRGGLLGKLKLLISRRGLPTTHRLIARPYPNDLKPRSIKVGKQLYEVLGVARNDADARDAHWRRNYEFFGAPTVLFIFAHKSFGLFSASDAGMFTQNITLSAHARGLGTVAQGAYSIWGDVATREFNVPKQYQYLYGIAIGHPSQHPVNDFKAERLPASEITLN